ncbi:MAG: xanthine dehydrogenase family protein subunit M [Hyphomicrobium sp.]|nr:xanthine dehydrogenase family protein subunit M [Hyphomicrobium sp.]
MKPAAFEYAVPATIAEAVALLAQHEGAAKPISGGQSLMPVLNFRLAAPSLLVDLRKLPGLDQIVVAADGTRLGARVRWRDIEKSTALAAAAGQPLLCAGIEHVAHYQIRNRGTVGGSLAHGDPAAEMPGLAVALDARLRIVGAGGERIVAAGEFYTGPLSTVLTHDELIVEVLLPPWPAARRWGFEEFARRRGDFALAGAAVWFDLDGAGRASNAHIGVIGLSDRPRRLESVEAMLNGKAVDAALIAAASAAASAAVDPLNDIHASADYRRALAATMVGRALTSAAGL